MQLKYWIHVNKIFFFKSEGGGLKLNIVDITNEKKILVLKFAA